MVTIVRYAAKEVGTNGVLTDRNSVNDLPIVIKEYKVGHTFDNMIGFRLSHMPVRPDVGAPLMNDKHLMKGVVDRCVGAKANAPPPVAGAPLLEMLNVFRADRDDRVNRVKDLLVDDFEIHNINRLEIIPDRKQIFTRRKDGVKGSTVASEGGVFGSHLGFIFGIHSKQAQRRARWLQLVSRMDRQV